MQRNSQAHYAKGTRSHIPSEDGIVLPLLVGTRFQVLFHSPSGVLFTFPSRYLFTIGQRGVISLGRWSSQIPAGFHVSCGTRVFFARIIPFVYGAVTRYGRPFQTVPLENILVTRRKRCRTSQRIPRPQFSNAGTLALNWFRLVPVRSPLLGDSQLLSLPPGT